MRSIVLTFDLHIAQADDYVRAYTALSEIGFFKEAENVQLPSTTLIGTWYKDVPLATIREALQETLIEAGLTPIRLMVIEFIECAFVGPPASPRRKAG